MHSMHPPHVLSVVPHSHAQPAPDRPTQANKDGLAAILREPIAMIQRNPSSSGQLSLKGTSRATAVETERLNTIAQTMAVCNVVASLSPTVSLQ